ncbi:helix-turn-helix domain-containing protein [Yoonia sp. R2-816]
MGANIRKARSDQRLTLNDLSRLSGVEAASLSKIENGKRDPKLSTLVEIAKALRTDLPILFQSQRDGLAKEIKLSQDGYDLDGE